MPTIDVTGAPDRLLANRTVTPSHCLMYVSRAIRNGLQPLIWSGLDTALNCWNLACGDKHDSRTVPRGFPAFLGATRYSKAGDVIISRGDGTFAATDWPGWGTVGTCTLEQREKQTGRKYLGYAGQFLGYTLTSTGTASLDVTPVEQKQERRKTMATGYYWRVGDVRDKGAVGEWALAGDAPGTDANWLTTSDQAVANDWAAVHGAFVFLGKNSYDAFRGLYLQPVRTAGGAVEGIDYTKLGAAIAAAIPAAPTKITGTLS